MLTSSTKQKIDNARDILVGKIPTPTGQVEHITLALMYKFMNDMDEINRELGGTAKFFSDDYRQYSWKQIMDRSLSAYERGTLYGEGLEKMSRNPNIPTLFREIFKRAFLPFRDPEVLTLFLKQIDEFSYDHSEELGNAFEYLLSIMGTQGEAGQLRSPRHIIDFMVKAVDPKKTDRILDPACGTAGFLISAYKHILEENTVKGSNRAGTKLTIEERKRLAQNFVGYDISHDMVRLSLVNMYLHEFPDPKIYEYDTLTSEERWDEDFDCILANPPFMTPKGGIRPHRRFSIQANRSEVLFVDYIMEHLSPNGKAGVIVPEGIIFQSASAYKALRKMFVEQNYIYAVVSLPAGVFQPYSGVKTSILLMDRVLAKKTEDILFVKIDNDGFDPGAQRRPIDRNDLPKALELLLAYKKALVEGSAVHPELVEGSKALIVPKSRIAESGDYNLTGDRYRETGIHINHEWPMVELGEVVEVNPSKKEISDYEPMIDVSFVPMSDLPQNKMLFEVKEKRQLKDVVKGYTYFRDNDILLAKITPCFENGKAGIARHLLNNIGFGSTEFIVLRAVANKVLPEWVYLFISENRFLNLGKNNMSGSAGQQRLVADFVKTYKIPFPPLDVQREIVTEIDGYQKIIDGAKQVVSAYKPKIKIDPSWETVEIGNLCNLIGGGTPSKSISAYWENGTIKWVSAKHITGDFLFDSDQKITVRAVKESSTSVIPANTIILVTRVSLGKMAITKDQFAINQDLTGLVIKDGDRINTVYLFLMLKEMIPQIVEGGQGLGVKGVTRDFVKKLKIPLPPLESQNQIVAQVEEEQRLVEANKRLVEIFERKIRERIDEVWGKET